MSPDDSDYPSVFGSDPCCDPDSAAGSKQFVYETSNEDSTVLYLEYWFYYRFNSTSDIPVPVVSDFDHHQSDWENVTVAVDTDTHAGKILWVSYSQHRNNFKYTPDELATLGALDDTHARAYVAAGTHANYPETCTSEFCDNYDVGAPGAEANHTGANEWMNDDDAVCARLCVDNVTDYPDIFENWTYRWGLHDIDSDPSSEVPFGTAPNSPGHGDNLIPFYDPADPGHLVEGSDHDPHVAPPIVYGPRH